MDKVLAGGPDWDQPKGPLSEDELRKAWELAKQSNGEKKALELLSDRDEKTVKRAFRCFQFFREHRVRRIVSKGEATPEEHARGIWAEDEICSRIGYDLSPRWARRLLDLHLEWEALEQGAAGVEVSKPAHGEAWKARHLERLIDLVDKIRQCLYPPRLRLIAEAGLDLPPPLEVNRINWALEPHVWLASVTPDFDMEQAWGPLLPFLREHLAQSLFWSHLAELRRAVQEYDRMLLEAAQKLAAKNPTFASFWEKVRFARERRLLPARTPLTPDATGEGLGPLDYNLAGVERVVELLQEVEPHLVQAQWDLVWRLEALHDDLLPDRVERQIAESTCQLCRNSSAE